MDSKAVLKPKSVSAEDDLDTKLEENKKMLARLRLKIATQKNKQHSLMTSIHYKNIQLGE